MVRQPAAVVVAPDGQTRCAVVQRRRSSKGPLPGHSPLDADLKVFGNLDRKQTIDNRTQEEYRARRGAPSSNLSFKDSRVDIARQGVAIR